MQESPENSGVLHKLPGVKSMLDHGLASRHALR